MSDNIFICKECKEEFNSKYKFGAHLRTVHSITAQLYWDKWYGKHFCECGKETKFLGINVGYQEYCCSKCAGKSSKSLDKRKKTNLEKYGVEFAQASDIVKEHAKNTCQEKYGCDSYICTLSKEEQSKNGQKSWTDDVRKQRENTCLEKYGVKHIAHSIEINKSRKRKYTYNNISFDSSWELAYYIWLTDNHIDFEYQPFMNFTYTFNNEIHYYNPDFILKDTNTIIEIKGDHFLKKGYYSNPFNQNDEKSLAKAQCMIKHNVKIYCLNEIQKYIRYVKKTYGKDYLKSFKNK